MRNLKLGLTTSEASARARLPVTLGDRQEVDSARHPDLPHHLHRNYRHWQWLEHLHADD